MAAISPYDIDFKASIPFIGIAGNIGIGKTTFTDDFAMATGYKAYHEPVDSNPYLKDFYLNKAKYAAMMQMNLLGQRFLQHQHIIWQVNAENIGCIQDRTIYEDVIFAKILHEDGDISDRDYETYKMNFRIMNNFLHRPDLIIYLDGSSELAYDRVNMRQRACEMVVDTTKKIEGIPITYLEHLRCGYEDWINSDIASKVPMLRLNWTVFKPISEVLPIINKFVLDKHLGMSIIKF